MPWVGFEPTIPAFERAKTIHALDRAATVTGYGMGKCHLFWMRDIRKTATHYTTYYTGRHIYFVVNALIGHL
jgi:hypothetical protein